MTKDCRLDQTELGREYILMLDVLQEYLEDGLSSACIIKTEDLYHEEDDLIIRAFTFSKGTREQIVVLGPDTHIYANVVMTKNPVSKRLIRDIIPILAKFYTDFLLDEE